MKRISLVSSDLNGTLVHQHTMSDMIRLYIGQKQYEEADAIFKKQTSGEATIEEAFGIAGPLTKGLTLRQAIEYTQSSMSYVNGFDKLVKFLNNREVPLVINSTGYSVTIYSIAGQLGNNEIHGQIGNILHFVDANGKVLSEQELGFMVKDFIDNPKSKDKSYYDSFKANGKITLGIKDESAKSELIMEYVQNHFSGISPNQILHIGDTMGDSSAILDIARQGGIGVAFNYNPALGKYLREETEKHDIAGEIYYIDPKSENSDLSKLLEVIQ